VIFIESPVFTRQVISLLSDDSYAEFQRFLAKQPDAGDVIQGTGGLRKIRWVAHGKGKRGGVRVIYFHVSARQQIRMLLIYRKGVKDDLTASEKKVLRALNEAW
jgi:mRNA-degrading endonuclease RelE of RelBE toxin-antitoxin system